jgi:hypothetical protein
MSESDQFQQYAEEAMLLVAHQLVASVRILTLRMPHQSWVAIEPNSHAAYGGLFSCKMRDRRCCRLGRNHETYYSLFRSTDAQQLSESQPHSGAAF